MFFRYLIVEDSVLRQYFDIQRTGIQIAVSVNACFLSFGRHPASFLPSSAFSPVFVYVSKRTSMDVTIHGFLSTQRDSTTECRLSTRDSNTG